MCDVPSLVNVVGTRKRRKRLCLTLPSGCIKYPLIAPLPFRELSLSPPSLHSLPPTTANTQTPRKTQHHHRLLRTPCLEPIHVVHETRGGLCAASYHPHVRDACARVGPRVQSREVRDPDVFHRSGEFVSVSRVINL